MDQNSHSNSEEIWKPIPGFEGLYEASSFGRIRSAPGKATSSARFKKRVWKTRIMKPKSCKNKYGRNDYRLTLWKDGKASDHLVARLVAITWLGTPEKNMTVNHINGNFLDNRPENLEWLTVSENIRYGFENGQFDSLMKKVTLVSEDGEKIDFRSMSQASLYLGRNVNYVLFILRRNKPYLTSSDGKRYSCFLKDS